MVSRMVRIPSESAFTTGSTANSPLSAKLTSTHRSTARFFRAGGTMIAMLVRGAKEKRKNDASPRLSVPATVVTKRTNVSHRHHNGANDMDYCTTDTTYYVTFQVESGDRMELRMSGRDYGMLFEGDRGTLHFQGTRYLGFDRS